MNKIFFAISIIVYILNYILTENFNIKTHNTLWSGISLMALFVPLCIGCVVNSSIYNKKNSALKFLFYYFSFMCSFGILLIAILSPIILKKCKRLSDNFAYFRFIKFNIINRIFHSKEIWLS